MTYQFDFSAIWANAGELLWGCAATLTMSIIAMACALALSIAAVLGLRTRPRWFRVPVGAFVELVRNTPFLIQIFFIYFGLPAIGVRQTEAARALGLHYWRRMHKVILPQALRTAIPPTVGFTELSRTGQLLSNITYQPLLVYSVVGAVYFVVCFPVSWIGRRMERKLVYG